MFFRLKILKKGGRGNLARPSKCVAVMSKNLIKLVSKFHFTDFLHVIEGVVVLQSFKKSNIKQGEALNLY